MLIYIALRSTENILFWDSIELYDVVTLDLGLIFSLPNIVTHTTIYYLEDGSSVESWNENIQIAFPSEKNDQKCSFWPKIWSFYGWL